MVSKFISRKLLVVLLTGILDMGIANGFLPAEVKPLLLQLITGLGGCYVLVQGIIDAIKQAKDGTA